MLLPPLYAVGVCFSSREEIARLIKALTHTRIDIKTVKKIYEGKGSIGKQEQFLAEMSEVFPPIRPMLPEIRNADITADDPKFSPWRFFLPEDVTSTEYDPKKLLSLIDNLESRSRLSIAFLHQGRFADAVAEMRHPFVVRYIQDSTWRAMTAAKNIEEFKEAVLPIFYLCLLIFLALIERIWAPNMKKSLLEICLPQASEKNDFDLFAIFVERIIASLGYPTKAEFLSQVMNANHSPSERRKIDTWLNGKQPNILSFRSFYTKAYEMKFQQLRRNDAFDPKEIIPEGYFLYYAMRSLKKLSAEPIEQHFESKAAFLALYPDIYETIGQMSKTEAPAP